MQGGLKITELFALLVCLPFDLGISFEAGDEKSFTPLDVLTTFSEFRLSRSVFRISLDVRALAAVQTDRHSNRKRKIGPEHVAFIDGNNVKETIDFNRPVNFRCKKRSFLFPDKFLAEKSDQNFRVSMDQIKSTN